MALLYAQPSASEVSLPEPPKLPDPRENAAAEISSALVADVRALVNAARHRAVLANNAELVRSLLGHRNPDRRDILGEVRAGYGEKIVSTLSRQLTYDHGAGFSRPNLVPQDPVLSHFLPWHGCCGRLRVRSECQRRMAVGHDRAVASSAFCVVVYSSRGARATAGAAEETAPYRRVSVRTWCAANLMISSHLRSRLRQKLEALPQHPPHDGRCHFLRPSAAPAVARRSPHCIPEVNVPARIIGNGGSGPRLLQALFLKATRCPAQVLQPHTDSVH